MMSLPLLPSGPTVRWITKLGIILALSTLIGCSDKSKTARGAAGGAAPVLAGKVVRKKVPLNLDAIGAVEPIRTADVRSQVTGILLKVAFAEGQDVNQGDLLFQIDPRSFENALRSAQADLEKARVQLETAQKEKGRYQTLNAQGLVSKEQYETILDAERTAQAAVLSSQAETENDQLQLDFCSIRAPIAGRTGSLGIHEGDLVRASDANVSLVTVNQLNPIYVTFSVPQQYLAAINRYRAEGTLAVTARPTGEGVVAEKGELTFVDNAIDATTGTLKLKATFPNENHVLWPGQYARVRLTLTSPEVLVVPSSAVQNDQTSQHVFVIRADHTAELRTVTVERSNEMEAVITKGLSEGETVVTDGQLRVLPGKPVEIKDPAAHEADAKGKGKATTP